MPSSICVSLLLPLAVLVLLLVDTGALLDATALAAVAVAAVVDDGDTFSSLSSTSSESGLR
jgi:hypothetical protein